MLASLAEELGLEWEWWWSCLGWVAQPQEGEQTQLMLFVPGMFYNLSGWAVRRACIQLGLESCQVILLHDDIDLDCFCWATRCGGSDGGNRGVRSVFQALDAGIRRLRMGVGRPSSRDPRTVAAHVLAPVDEELLQTWQVAARNGELLQILGMTRDGSLGDFPPPSRGRLTQGTAQSASPTEAHSTGVAVGTPLKQISSIATRARDALNNG